MSDNNEHAEVGALLAKCAYIEIDRTSRGWTVWACIPGGEACCYQGDTQLAAIRAAVKAAEKGVRE